MRTVNLKEWSDGSLAAWGDNQDGQCYVPFGNDFIAIAAGTYNNIDTVPEPANVLLLGFAVLLLKKKCQ